MFEAGNPYKQAGNPVVMRKSFVAIVLSFFFVALSVFAFNTVDEHNLVLDFKENISLNLEQYSYVNIRTREGSAITVEVGESKNDFLLKSIERDGSATLVFKDKTRTEELLLGLGGRPTQVQIQDEIPVIFVENIIFHPGESAEERNIVLKFTVPVVNKFNKKRDVGDKERKGEDKINNPEELPEVKGNNLGSDPSSVREKDPYLKYFLAVIIVLLIIIVVLGPKQKKPEMKREDKPVKKLGKKDSKEEQRSENPVDRDEK